MPPGCSSEKPETVQDFIIKAKAALVAVGIVRDSVLGTFSFCGIWFFTTVEANQYGFCAICLDSLGSVK